MPLAAALGLVGAGTVIGMNMSNMTEWFTGLRKEEKLREDQVVSEPLKPVDTPLVLPYLSDSVFETTDNMLVFMFPSEEKFRQQTDGVRSIIREFQAAQNRHASLQPVKVLYTIVPPSRPDVDTGDKVEVMCYKGQRKLRSSIDVAAPIEDWSKFFEFLSTPVDQELTGCVIEHIAGSEFDSKVLTASSVEKPILLQLYEKSCFLCFLMRPFLNQLSTILKQAGVPIELKRMDIEENDFPDKLPVVRGTPTFVLFQGEGKPGIRLEEFKPRDLVRRICLDYSISREVEATMYALVDKVAIRFQLFSGIIMWNTESEKILDMMAGDQKHHLPTIPFDAKSAEDKDKEMFNKYVSELMSEDMLKVDLLDDNVEDLKRELARAEMHAITMGQVLGEKTLDKEPNV